MEMDAWTSWRPLDTDAQPWIQVTLTQIYAVKALFFTGKRGLNGSYVGELTLSYGLSADSLTSYGSVPGPSHRTDLAVKYFPIPMVTRVVRLQPTQWDGPVPDLAFTLLGQPYSACNHSDYYVGCFADPSMSLLGSGTPASSLEQCQTTCQGHSSPFFGLLKVAGQDWCGCSDTLGQHGELDPSSCNHTCLDSPCGSDVTRSVALYRAYETKCDALHVVNASRQETHLVTFEDGVMGVGSTATLTCPVGMELAGLGENLTLTCLPNTTWSHTPPPACTYVECGVPPESANNSQRVQYTNVTYGSEAVYVCDENTETEEGLGFKRTRCSHTKEWLPSFQCEAAKTQRNKRVRLRKRGHRLTGSLTSLRTRSRTGCAVSCITNNMCVAYSVPTKTSTVAPGATSVATMNCMQLVGYDSLAAYVADSDWDVYVVDQ
ncbi:uncharacterized protein LOC143290330 [Babylonia areolata]|uniref:uncharacterized protein LOC143290330 n=1 Tax=Babylonia areolata TaxID=304850 RepID=UPI003FD15BC6